MKIVSPVFLGFADAEGAGEWKDFDDTGSSRRAVGPRKQAAPTGERQPRLGARLGAKKLGNDWKNTLSYLCTAFLFIVARVELFFEHCCVPVNFSFWFLTSRLFPLSFEISLNLSSPLPLILFSALIYRIGWSVSAFFCEIEKSIEELPPEEKYFFKHSLWRVLRSSFSYLALVWISFGFRDVGYWIYW